MRPKTKDEIYDLLKDQFTIAALGAALELGLFWLLNERPMVPDDVSIALGIPMNRCIYSPASHRSRVIGIFSRGICYDGCRTDGYSQYIQQRYMVFSGTGGTCTVTAPHRSTAPSE